MKKEVRVTELRGGLLRVGWTLNSSLDLVRRIYPLGPRRRLLWTLPWVRDFFWLKEVRRSHIEEMPNVIGGLYPELGDARFAFLRSRPGLDGRMIVAMDRGSDMIFCKIPLGDRSRLAIEHESITLSSLNGTWGGAITPKVIGRERSGALLLNDLGEQPLRPFSQRFKRTVLDHVLGVMQASRTCATVQDARYLGMSMHEMRDAIQRVLPSNAHGLIELVSQWTSLVDGLVDRAPVVMLAEAHGDLTPWNIWLEGDRSDLYAIDFERFERQAPLGFDVFHFLVSAYLDKGSSAHSDVKAALLDGKRWLRKGLGVSDDEANNACVMYILFSSGARILELLEQEVKNPTIENFTAGMLRLI